MENIKILNNTNEDISIRLFKVNMLQKIEAGSFLMLTVNTSEEADYYKEVVSELDLQIEEIEPTPSGYNKTLYYQLYERNIFSYTLTVSAEDMEAGEGTVEESYLNLMESTEYPQYEISFTTYEGDAQTLAPGTGMTTPLENKTDLTEASLDAKMQQVINSVTYAEVEKYSVYCIKQDEQTGETLYDMTMEATPEVIQAGEGSVSVTITNFSETQTLYTDSVGCIEVPPGETITESISESTVTDYNTLYAFAYEAFDSLSYKQE